MLFGREVRIENQGEVTRGNDFEGQRVSGGLDFSLGTSTRAFVSGRYSESSREGFPDDSGGYEFADIRDTEHRDADETVFGAGFDTHAGAATFALQLGYFDRNDHIDSPGVAPGIRDPFGVPASVVDTNLTRYSATFTGTQKFSEHVLDATNAWQLVVEEKDAARLKGLPDHARAAARASAEKKGLSGWRFTLHMPSQEPFMTYVEDEELRLGKREIYVHYPSGMGRSKLKIPAAKAGTARNLNTVAKLAEMAAKS